MEQKRIAMLSSLMAVTALGAMGAAPPMVHPNKPIPGGYRSNRRGYHAPGWHPKKPRNQKGKSR